MKDVIGLIHPECVWHKNSKLLRGKEVVVKEINECHTRSGWYSITAQLIDPPASYRCIARSMSFYGVRLRRVAG